MDPRWWRLDFQRLHYTYIGNPVERKGSLSAWLRFQQHHTDPLLLPMTARDRPMETYYHLLGKFVRSEISTDYVIPSKTAVLATADEFELALGK